MQSFNNLFETESTILFLWIYIIKKTKKYSYWNIETDTKGSKHHLPLESSVQSRKQRKSSFFFDDCCDSMEETLIFVRLSRNRFSLNLQSDFSSIKRNSCSLWKENKWWINIAKNKCFSKLKMDNFFHFSESKRRLKYLLNYT